LADQESLHQVVLHGQPVTPDAVWVASVAGDTLDHELRSAIRTEWGVEPWFAQTRGSLAGLTNSYHDPVRMGVDRWLVMLALWRRQQGRFCAVDAGSALTIDLVDEQGIHQGGYIIPGPTLMERALFQDTQRVRFNDDLPPSLQPGKSTGEAVRHGVTLSLAGALRVFIDIQQLSAPEVFITGGWGQQLRDLACPEALLEPDLVFEGLELQASLECVHVQ